MGNWDLGIQPADSRRLIAPRRTLGPMASADAVSARGWIMGLYVSDRSPACVYSFLLGWDIFRLGEELFKRSYILVGFIAWITLMPLAITSTKRWVQRLGPGWKRLHQSIYIAMALAAVHYLMTVRSDYAWAGSYAMVVILILALRFAMWRQTR